MMLEAYEVSIQYGPDYLIPKPFDARVLIWEASAVAGCSGRGFKLIQIRLQTYREQLESRLGLLVQSCGPSLTGPSGSQGIVFSEGEDFLP